MKFHKLFEVEDLPVFQNKMYSDRLSAINLPERQSGACSKPSNWIDI